MLTTYFDDSGTSPAQDVAVVAGYVGSVIQWDRFKVAWRLMLDEFGIKAMHRTDLESFEGEFKGWTPERRKELVQKAQKIIKNPTHTYVPIGSAVIKADFDEIIPKRLQEHVGGHYGWCVTEAMVLANYWAQKAKHRDPIDWVFEAGTNGSVKVSEMFNRLYAIPDARERLRIHSWSFSGKCVLPLQAADVASYEVYKFVLNQVVYPGKYPVRLSAIDLFGDKNDYLLMWDKKRLAGFVAEPENVRRLSKLLSSTG
jgi:hypothetical protein